MDAGDWRNQLQPDSRQKIVNKIMETLKRLLPFSGTEGMDELSRIAARFEEKIYASSMNQTDYLRKISLKTSTMENGSENNVGGSTSSLPAAYNSTPPGSGNVEFTSWQVRMATYKYVPETLQMKLDPRGSHSWAATADVAAKRGRSSYTISATRSWWFRYSRPGSASAWTSQ